MSSRPPTFPRRAILGAAMAVPLVSGPWSLHAQVPPDATPAPRLRVAVSTSVLADIVANVAGDRANVTPVMPAAADPHTWEAAAGDIAAIQEVDTFIWMGAFLERFIEAGGWRRAVADVGVPALRLADHMELIVRDVVIDHGDHTHDLTEGDPHVWLDPLKTIEMVEVVRAHLSGIDPDGATVYQEQATAYAGRLTSIHVEYESGLAVLPPEERKLVVLHDAFSYFAARYGFTVVGVVIRNPSAQPSANEIAELIDTIEREGVPAVFREPQFDAKILDVIGDETGVIIGELVTDSFAGRVASYEELLRFNLDSVVTHLVPGGSGEVG